MGSAGLAKYSLRVSGAGYETCVRDDFLFALNDPTDVGTIRMTKTAAPVEDPGSKPSQPTDDGEYTMLYTEDDLAAISGKPGKYKLANDIDAVNYGKKIGNMIGELNEDAELNGGGHTIRINVTNPYDGGIIGTNYGVIRDLHVTGTVAFGISNTFGGIVQENRGLIENCSFEGTIRSTSGTSPNANGSKIGGICGYAAANATMENCINRAAITVTITGDCGGAYYRAYVGGIYGYSNGLKECEAIHCLNTAAIKADTSSGITRVGGIGGWSGTASDCGNTGTSIYAGYGSDKPSYLNSYADVMNGSGYTTGSTVLYDSENGKRTVENAGLSWLTIYSSSKILSMW